MTKKIINSLSDLGSLGRTMGVYEAKAISGLDWLSPCDKCDGEIATVHTTQNEAAGFDTGDRVTCECCGHTGVMNTEHGAGFVLWEDWE